MMIIPSMVNVVTFSRDDRHVIEITLKSRHPGKGIFLREMSFAGALWLSIITFLRPGMPRPIVE
jgi:hypothetical protein